MSRLARRTGVTPATLKTLATRPRLWPATLATARSMVPPGWWRRAPFLPVPDKQWLHFRMVTAYGGDGSTPPDVDDVVTFIEWRRQVVAGQGTLD